MTPLYVRGRGAHQVRGLESEVRSQEGGAEVRVWSHNVNVWLPESLYKRCLPVLLEIGATGVEAVANQVALAIRERRRAR